MHKAISAGIKIPLQTTKYKLLNSSHEIPEIFHNANTCHKNNL